MTLPRTEIASAIPSEPQNQSNICDYYPEFNQQSEISVWVANSRYDASCYRYIKPRVLLVQTGFLIDFGDRLGLVASTWQGSSQSKLSYQDLLFLLEKAHKRTRDEQEHNHPQKGLWSQDWLIGGTNAAAVVQLRKMQIDFIKKTNKTREFAQSEL